MLQNNVFADIYNLFQFYLENNNPFECRCGEMVLEGAPTLQTIDKGGELQDTEDPQVCTV